MRHLNFMMFFLLTGFSALGTLAQEMKYPPVAEYLMPQAAEIALAKSAAPDNISDKATIKILTASGFQVVREGDTVARVGGDEFVLIIEPWTRSASEKMTTTATSSRDRLVALGVTNRVVGALRGPIAIDGVEHQITASVGLTYPSVVAMRSSSGITAAEVLAEADAAMYQAKRRGKDRFEVFTNALDGAPGPVSVF